MVIKNAGLKTGVFDILIEDGVIGGIGEFDGANVIDAEGKRVIPGMIDTHIHGFGGYDTSDNELERISVRLAKEGTTTWYPTAMTDSHENLKKITSFDINVGGANIPGFHLEGPYISALKKGAQNEAYIKSPDIKEFSEYKNVKKITVAPEVDGVPDFIKNVDCVVSIGHTACSYDEAMEAIRRGANCLTHTFNAMPPMLHREPGPIGAGAECGIYAELICDGRHVHKAAVQALFSMFGKERVVLVSDTIRPAGLPDGKYDSGGLDVYVKDGAIALENGVLAGGSIPLLGCVKKAVEFGVDFYDAVRAATENPARLMGLNKGTVAEGYDADLLIINDDITVDTVIIGGKVVA